MILISKALIMNAAQQSFNSLLQAYLSQTPQMDQNVDKRRIEVLLQINTILLYKCIGLQQFILNQQNTSLPDYPARKELYNNYLKRIHYNLSCLASINDIYSSNPSSKRNYVLPQIVYPPQECPELYDHYKTLNQLYPEAIPFYQKKISLARQQQQQQQQQQERQQQGTTNGFPQFNLGINPYMQGNGVKKPYTQQNNVLQTQHVSQQVQSPNNVISTSNVASNMSTEWGQRKPSAGFQEPIVSQPFNITSNFNHVNGNRNDFTFQKEQQQQQQRNFTMEQPQRRSSNNTSHSMTPQMTPQAILQQGMASNHSTTPNQQMHQSQGLNPILSPEQILSRVQQTGQMGQQQIKNAYNNPQHTSQQFMSQVSSNTQNSNFNQMDSNFMSGW
ncbi:uncharacterized protein C5L36_0C06305 [Pichia kudriavzevii]|uniref:Uncharacterized protein n=1 Tax=Pichia kudriavzevii TaxID=4909 RepID=A0A2U9R5R3_PICKU|nr:uncharacterized protein C5L36_0C06305 [Pichia kudriavzevii]AWU76707.1 hypothetical protein C5L36_0C06305 [Pichia kudriavzevii]